jgi:hypothetical protein
MKQIYNDAGQLTEDGKKATEEFKEMAKALMSAADNISGVSVTNSILANMLGNLASEEILKRKS